MRTYNCLMQFACWLLLCFTLVWVKCLFLGNVVSPIVDGGLMGCLAVFLNKALGTGLMDDCHFITEKKE